MNNTRSKTLKINLLTIHENKNLNNIHVNIKLIEKITPMEDITKPTDRKRIFKISPTEKAFDLLIKNENNYIDCEYPVKVNLEVEQPASL